MENQASRNPIYTVTALQYDGSDTIGVVSADGTPVIKEHPDFGAIRTFGFFYDKARAIEAAHDNEGDLREALYDFIVIEKYEPGMNTVCDTEESVWLKWDDSREGFFEIESPHGAEHICNFALC